MFCIGTKNKPRDQSRDLKPSTIQDNRAQKSRSPLGRKQELNTQPTAGSGRRPGISEPLSSKGNKLSNSGRSETS